MKKINVAVQIIPIVSSEKVFPIVDKAIEYIAKTGIKYRVTPFETVLEGDLDEIFKIIKGAQNACYNAGANELITNIKIHSSKTKDLFIEDKVAKYD
ncbi:MAG: MTH1187 family thiamine-binding protein [Bacteroidales bacterium]|nr:MTH1187 family thiamine-binding protein [Bacteroidales bacterium]